ncbi:MAG: DinB family protein [Acidobacteriota bacterium]|nr:MAG: DinB family protein [Acidobacteriota bacterium]
MLGIREIRQELSKSYFGEAWHGPSLKQALQGVGEQEVWTRVHPEVHTVGEIVLHLRTWMQSAEQRISGRMPFESVTDEQDWPSGSEAEDWSSLMNGLDADFDQLLTAVGQLEESELFDSIAGTKDNRFELILGILQHNIYHAGQIVLLRKLHAGGVR